MVGCEVAATNVIKTALSDALDGFSRMDTEDASCQVGRRSRRQQPFWNKLHAFRRARSLEIGWREETPLLGGASPQSSILSLL